jgi:ParB family transcriptional regulator, chromosome partitioning protein
MAQATPKISLSVSRDIPFNKLKLSDSNVRRTKAGVAIEQLADDIARRTLLQSLTVRPVLDDNGAETGMYEIPAGGRRYRALELLVRQKRLAKTAPIPCVIRTDGLAEEDSLAENSFRIRCYRSISSAPSWGCGKRASPSRKSPPRSSSRSRW